MPSIAIVGAGPGMGLAIARTFGSHGFAVALVARNRAMLDGLVDTLTAEGITAAAFPADVLDHAALTQALNDAATRFGSIDVLEYSPLDAAATALTTPSQSCPSDIQAQIDIQLYGAMAVTQAVLPAMRAAGSGTLLYTTGAGSLDPFPAVANVNAAAAALRNWAVNLHKELADSGIQAAHVAIDVTLGVTPVIPDFPTATPEEVSPVYWELHTNRDEAEHVFTANHGATA
jgi:NADP-dependent 3-hydroxy acid dehydrogenase YdfG